MSRTTLSPVTTVSNETVQLLLDAVRAPEQSMMSNYNDGHTIVAVECATGFNGMKIYTVTKYSIHRSSFLAKFRKPYLVVDGFNVDYTMKDAMCTSTEYYDSI